jgi:hypothetical protein
MLMGPYGRMREGKPPKEALGKMAMNTRMGAGSHTDAKH